MSKTLLIEILCAVMVVGFIDAQKIMVNDTYGNPECNPATWLKYDSSCCTTEKPCGIGEGDCDKDYDCAGHLICGKNNCGYKFTNKKADCCYKDPCVPNPCQNNGKCTIKPHDNDFECQCQEDYFGFLCDQYSKCYCQYEKGEYAIICHDIEGSVHTTRCEIDEGCKNETFGDGKLSCEKGCGSKGYEITEVSSTGVKLWSPNYILNYPNKEPC